MIPVLFKGNETNFNHNGIGLLKDTLSCEVSEVRNGSFDLELVYPITGSYFKDLKNGNIIQAKPNDTDQPHNFRITEIDKTLSDKEVVVYGVSTTNDLGGNMVKSLYLEDLTPQVILNEMKNALHYPTSFNFVSNITTIGSVDWELNNPLNLIVGEEGSLVDIFGGEVKRTNDTIYLYGRRGKDNVTTIRAGKNLDGFKMTESFQGKYTQILPYFKYEAEVPGEIAGDTEGETVRQEVTVFGNIVSSPYHGRYPVNAIKPIDFSQNEVVRESKSLDALNLVASKYFSNLYSEIDKPSVSINVDMIQLVDSEQYELYERLEKVELTDTVSVYVPEYDVDILVKINELKYDSLRERTISIVAGSSSSGRTSLMDEISGSYKQFTTKLVDDKIQSATSGIINQILTQKNGNNMYAGRATPPDNSKPGDIWFKDTGGGDVELYEFDGVNWVRKMYKGFGDDVRQMVDDKIAESNALFTGAIDEQAEAVEQAKALAQLAKTTATNASLSASAANQDAQQAIADAANAKESALSAITKADDIRTELLGRVNTLDSKAADLTTKTTNLQTLGNQLNTKATDLKTQADNISSQLNTFTTETGTKFQNQSKIITDLQGTLSQYESTIQTIDGTVTNHTSQLTQQADQIASKVSQTEFNTEKTKIRGLQTSITQQADQIALKAEKTYVDTVKQTVDSNTTSITQQAGQIALKAEKTELDNLTGRMSTAEGKITTQAGLIELKAAKTDLTPIINSLNTKVDINQVNSAITVGTQSIRQEVSSVKGVLEGGISARNYAVGTATPSTHSVDSRISTTSSGYLVKQVYSTYKNTTLRDLGFKVGDKYTVIFDIYAENNTSFKEYRVEGYHSGYSHLIGSITNTIGTSSNPTQFVGSFTITEDSHLTAYRWFIRFDLSYFNVTVKNFRIFKGEIKQDWYPAWEDQEAALESTKARVDITEKSITSLVTGAKNLPDGRTSVFATKIESLEGAINQRVTTQELNNRGYQTSTDVTNTINNRTDLARKTDIPTYVGGRNLAQKTSSEWSTAYASFSGSVNTCPQLYKVLVDDLAIGDTLKTRIVLKYTNIVPASGRTASIWLQGDGNVTAWNAGCYSNSTYTPISGSGEMVFEHELKITADHLKNQFWNLMFRTDYIASGSLQWKLAKVEKGPLWTAWSPAPEDTEAALTDKLAGYVTNQTYSTYTTNRQQTDQQITEQINQTVSKVPTGPVNLIVNGFDPQTIAPWKLWDTTNWTLELTTHEFFYNGTKKLMRFKTSTGTTKGTFESNVFNLKRNTKYTIRVGIFANSNCKDLRFCFGRGTSTSISDYIMAHKWFVGSQTKLEYKTITVDSGNYDYGKLTFDHNGTKTVGSWADMYIAEISIIEGEMNNSWTPSFDELITNQKFNETKSTVDAFSRAIGTRDENGVVPNIARLVMTQDAVISEVAKYGDHTSNLVQDSVRFSTTIDMNGSNPTVIKDGNITWRRSESTTYTFAGIGIPVNVNRFIAGEKYTLSFDYYLYKSPDEYIGVEIKDHTNNLGYCYGTIATASTPILTYHHFQQTFTIATGTSSNTTDQNLYFYLAKNGDIGIRNVMLVRGEKIGPYSPSQMDSVTTRVEQTANSYAIKFLNNANDITTQLNLTNSGVRIKSSLIQLDGNVTVSGTSWMDGAVIKNLSADKITTGTLNANNVNITNLSVDDVSGITSTYLQSVIGTAFIDWMKGKIIQGYNNRMTIDLMAGNITLNSGSNAIKRVSGTHTAFVHFNDVKPSEDGGVGSIYASIGVTSSGDGVNSMSSGRFSGLRAFRSANGTEHTATIDQTEIYGDRILMLHGFTLAQGFQIRPTNLDKLYDLNDDVLNPIRFFSRVLFHLNNVRWNWQDRAFIEALKNEWTGHGMSRYGRFQNDTIYYPIP